MTKQKLTPKQTLFVDEYLIDLNATQAAIRAGYSPKTAEVQGSRLLSNAKVAEAVDAKKIERSEKTGVDASWVLERLALEVNADLADLYEDNGTLKPIHDWPEIWRKGLVSGIDVVQEYETVDGKKTHIGSVTKLKISERVKRIELIGKHVVVQAFNDKLELTGKGGGPIEIEDKTPAAVKAAMDAIFRRNGTT